MKCIKYTLLIWVIVFISGTYAQKNFTVQVANFSFTPRDITITAGDTVTFMWVSGTHTTTSDSTTGPDAWNSPMNSTTSIFKVVILYPGLHSYYCIFHGGPGGVGMAGTITANQKAPTEVRESNTVLTYNLEQNYPNPFNPMTTIDYSIPENSLVVLKVFNVLGEEVKTLVNEVKSRGRYSVSLNASELTSGIYYYQIRAGNYISVKKMTLLK
ncbi:MAG: T9SS type A sorting domain-containing protein [Bacteroidota bacterium]|nr:T9SS type A sorting domain-containing protein [Bacteroidota bacterium]MDP4192231.1 T9SS type A sorting domain-containing protein [Bacteroidota bacterium]MDP4196482.1 T9SS type A sorting domain-containing protein [Bacteroidota bacterium]